MTETDPSSEREPRERLNEALGVLSRQREVNPTDALQLLLRWSGEFLMSVLDVADLVVADAHLRGQPPDG